MKPSCSAIAYSSSARGLAASPPQLTVDLPHPRDEDTILEPDFLALKRNALAHLKL